MSMQRQWSTEDAFPQVRITTIAHQHLTRAKEALRRIGQSRSMTDLASAAILSIPIPIPDDDELNCGGMDE